MGVRRLRIYAGLAAAIGWFALGLQFILIVTTGSDISVAGRVVNFFSFFTILSNILVALVLSSAALAIGSGRLAILTGPKVRAAAALYIGFTGVIYFLLLRTLWEPQGWQLVADAILHYATPVLYLVFWAVFVPKGRLRLADVRAFLVFPVLYAIYSLLRGPLVDWYPYPFLDPGRAGIGLVAINVIFLIMGFGLGSAALIVLDSMMAPAGDKAPSA
jgi:hypothetical protein